MIVKSDTFDRDAIFFSFPNLIYIKVLGAL